MVKGLIQTLLLLSQRAREVALVLRRPVPALLICPCFRPHCLFFGLVNIICPCLGSIAAQVGPFTRHGNLHSP